MAGTRAQNGGSENDKWSFLSNMYGRRKNNTTEAKMDKGYIWKSAPKGKKVQH